MYYSIAISLNVMRITTIIWARNEEDILEPFLRHTASFADAIIIVLHRSRDGSEAMVRKLQAEGLPIRMSKDESPAHRQAAALTELLRTMSDRPDWIVPLDADEFLLSERDIRDTIATLPTDRTSAVPWNTYVPTPDDDVLEKNPILRITHRRAIEDPQYRKVIIPGSLLDHDDLHIQPGSHCVAFGEELQSSIPTEALRLGHFPVRSEAQLRRKIIEGWQSVLANPDRIPGEEFHWEKLVRRCADPQPIDAHELMKIATHYAQDVKTEVLFDPVFQRERQFA